MPETQEEREARTAVEIAHVHLALHNPKSRKWASRVRRRTSLLGITVPPVTEAIDRLAVRGEPATLAEGVHRKHGDAVLAQIYNLTHKDPANRRLNQSLRNHLSDKGISIPAIEASLAPGKALGKAHDPTLDLEITGPCDVDDAGVTRFNAQVTRPRTAADTFKELASGTNPKNWAKTFPQQFSKAFETDSDSASLFESRFADPPEQPPTPADVPWKGLFFENFSPSFCGVPIEGFRNILEIKFEAQSNPDGTGVVNFQYDLYESLTNRIFEGPIRGGGIDIDSNDKDSCRVELAKNEVQIKAGKNIRYSNETGMYQEELNLIALPALATWIVAILLQVPPPNTSDGENNGR
jgi:hypothetical protein